MICSSKAQREGEKTPERAQEMENEEEEEEEEAQIGNMALSFGLCY